MAKTSDGKAMLFQNGSRELSKEEIALVSGGAALPIWGPGPIQVPEFIHSAANAVAHEVADVAGFVAHGVADVAGSLKHGAEAAWNGVRKLI